MVLGPVLPLAGCWLGLEPHPDPVERQYLFRARKILPALGILAFIAKIYVMFNFDWQGSKFTAKVFWCAFEVFVVLPQIVVNLCLLCLQDTRALRHTLYVMFFIFLAVNPSLFTIRDIANQATVWAVCVRRALTVALYAMLQLFCFGSISGQMLLLSLPSFIVYLAYGILREDLVETESNRKIEIIEMICLGSFAQTLVAIMCVSLIWRRWHMFTSALTKVTPISPNLSSISIMPASLGRATIDLACNVSSQVSAASLPSVGAPEAHATDIASRKSAQQLAPSEEHYFEPNNASTVPAAVLTVGVTDIFGKVAPASGGIDFHSPPQFRGEPDVECHFSTFGGNVRRRGFNASTRVRDLIWWICNDLEIDRYATRLVYEHQIFTCLSEDRLCDLTDQALVEFVIWRQSKAHSSAPESAPPIHAAGAWEVISTCTVETATSGPSSALKDDIFGDLLKKYHDT